MIPNPKRKTWGEYFMAIAHEVSSRSTCDRKHVGCVITIDRRIVATGFNGSVPGMPHCDDVGHDMVNGHCVRTVHAEANAVVQAARFGVKLEGAKVYVNTFPCWPCFKLLAAVNVMAVYFDDLYRVDERVNAVAKDHGIPLLGPEEWRPRFA
jgi:dCMP deaminase